MSESGQKPRGGCFTAVLKAFGIVVLAWIAILLIAQQQSEYEQRTSSPSASTPSVTAMPTSTPAPDDCIAWATYYANGHMPKDMALTEVQISTLGGDNYLSIACDMDVMWDSDDYIRTAAEFICDMIPLLRDKQGFDHITFLFYGPFIDKYGNDVQSLGLRAMYSRATLQKINTKYFDDHLYSDPEGIFEAADTHMIHTLYKD